MAEKRKDNKGRILREGESQRSDGMYMFRYTDQAGKRKTVYSWKLVSTDKVPDGKKAKTALREIEKEIRRDLEDGIRSADANAVTVNELFESFMGTRIDLRETTRNTYRILYNKHIRWGLGSKKIKEVRNSDVKKLYLYLSQDLGLKISTIETVHCILYQTFDGAVMDNLIRSNPATNALKTLRQIPKEKNKRHALSEEEQERFIDFVYQSSVFCRWGPLFTVLLGTGMRIGEALGLRWCDCDFDEEIITVSHTLHYQKNESSGEFEFRISEPKTKAGCRIIPMFNEVKQALKQERDKPHNPQWEPFNIGNYSDFVFLNSHGRVPTPMNIFQVVQNIINGCNREEALLSEQEGREPCYLPKFSPHILRHTFCTRLCENEPNIKIVQEIMGHSNISTTMDVYNEATKTKKQESFKNLEGKIKLS